MIFGSKGSGKRVALYRFAKERGLNFVFSFKQLVDELLVAKPDTTILLIDEFHLAWSFNKNDFKGLSRREDIEKDAALRLHAMKRSTVGVVY